jgi:Zn-finger nucleic acid-binding protein
VQSAEGVRIFRGAHSACPQCRTTLLFRHFFNPALDLEVDQCARCAGFWIEAGRLGAMQVERSGERVAEYFGRIFEESITVMDVANPDVRGAANALVKILVWMCPVRFIPEPPPWWLEEPLLG